MSQGLTAPQLPTTISGDGRYVMSLLSDFCTDAANEVNRANGITASNETPTAIGDFFVSFDREGVLWRWNSVAGADYYELTAGDTLLTRTPLTTSRAAPTAYSGTVTLTAYLADGTRITETLDYTKPRPFAPTNITLSRTSDGTLITYDSVPADCIGAQLTIDGKTYRTTDDSFFYAHAAGDRLTEISVSYYDSFSAGEAATVRSDVPTVTGFFAEQNGEWLDLAWDSLPLYDVRYTVKAAYRSPDWDSARDLITVRTSHARLRFPQSGEVYFLIKAFDTYGNASPTAAWTTLDRAADYRRNVLVTLDQSETAYSGTKTSLYYDAVADGLRLDDGKRRGEYIFSVHLPQVYRARSWLGSKIIGVTDDTLAWDDSTFGWASEDAETTVWNGACGDIGGAVLRAEIAEAAAPTEGETVWTMDSTLLASDDTAPTVSQHADTFRAARWNQGLVLAPLTRLAYAAPVGRTFGLVFHLVLDAAAAPAEIVSLRSSDGALTLRLQNGAFTLYGTDSEAVSVPYTTESRDYLAVGIEQTDTHRTLRLASLAQQTDRARTIDSAPCADMSEICWYPR